MLLIVENHFKNTLCNLKKNFLLYFICCLQQYLKIYTTTIPIFVIEIVIDHKFHNWNVIDYYTEVIIIMNVIDKNNYNYYFL